MMAPPYPMTGNRYSSIRNNNLKGMDNIGIYQRNHIVMLDSRKSLCVVPYKNSNIFWYLVGPPKPLGPHSSCHGGYSYSYTHVHSKILKSLQTQNFFVVLLYVLESVVFLFKTRHALKKLQPKIISKCH